jgi:NAD(P)-dependent dehydrogenase (short-subunit alcohol dehydrogenase family)
MDINGASAIVTGGASGIGAATARLLAAKGAKVVIADLQADKGEALAKEIGGAFYKVDVTKTEDIMNAIEMAKDMGPLRVLVNSAGIGWAQRTVGKDGSYDSAANLDAYKKVIAINLVGTFDCIRLAATAMSTTEPLNDGERGAIVNISCCIRWSDWTGCLLIIKGWRCWYDIADRSRLGCCWRTRQHSCSWPHQHTDLR